LINANNILIDPQMRKTNYHPLTSFEPICNLVNVPMVFVVNSASPYRTLADLLDAARAKPGDLTLASVGPGTPQHVGFEMLKRAANVTLTYVPYPGSAPAVNALLGEHVTSLHTGYTAVVEQLKAGKLRALATSSRTRIEALPEVPTVAESGYKDYEADQWYGVLAPAKTPRETVSQLTGWFVSALQVPEVKAKLVLQGPNAAARGRPGRARPRRARKPETTAFPAADRSLCQPSAREGGPRPPRRRRPAQGAGRRRYRVARSGPS
jgi:tripartite-type tricarboxylate transporter receptor subunit TctC